MSIDDSKASPVQFPSLPTLLHRLPPEVRLHIFQFAFQPETAREIITVSKSIHNSSSASSSSFSPRSALDLHFKDQHKTKSLHQFARLKLWLQPSFVGPELAMEAAEALYRSNFIFAVHASDLTSFLRACPLTGLSEPGQCVSRLNLYADEDPNFIGDGKHGQGLRLADWVDLHDDANSSSKRTRSNGHTLLMRSCWRDLLRMPRLRSLECRVVPIGGKLELRDIHGCEIRDMLPSLFRLFNKGVAVRLYLHAWTKVTRDDYPMFPCGISGPTSHQAEVVRESALDLDSFLPFGGHCVRVPEEKYRGRELRVERMEPPTHTSSLAQLALENFWGPFRAHYRASMYYALDTLFLRLLASRDYQLINSDFVKKHHKTHERTTLATQIPTQTQSLLFFSGLLHALHVSVCGDEAKDNKLMLEYARRQTTTSGPCGWRGLEDGVGGEGIGSRKSAKA